ncbi:hypothetical protein [Sagittula sp. SSi028]|uniref:hypothetical protein n=1 Tax=Sagittula sp. SSi028 TaxID=3400636 RepID=UPI003AF89101
MRVLVLILAFVALPFKAVAQQERQVLLYAPPALVETGVMQHILPRFKLKTQIAVLLVQEADTAQAVFHEAGSPLFIGAGGAWGLRLRYQTQWTERFADWLRSEIGLKTVLSFAPDGAPLFAAPVSEIAPEVRPTLTGDAEQGHDIAVQKCGRCHAVDEATRLTGIGSTPSFALLRGFADWEHRFIGFFALNPHPSFTQIEDVTPPFDPLHPSPIVPVEMTLPEVEAVAAYVATLGAADLGAPLQNQ